MASATFALIALFALQLPSSGPGCIAAVTAVPTGAVFSGQTVTFADGTLVNPLTRFLSRSWTFGDGSSVTSTQSAQLTATHAYVNRTGHTIALTARLSERTGLGSCTTTYAVTISPISI